MLLSAVPDEWAAEAFTKGLNPLSSDASRKLKESLLEFQATTWEDVHNRYESKIRTEDDQLGSSASLKGRNLYRNQDKLKNDFDVDQRPSRSHFQPYERADGCGKRFQSSNMFIFDRRTDRGQNSRSLQEKEAPGSRDPSSPRTRDYQHLREEVATLLKNGHLREFLSDPVKNNYGRNWDNAEPSKPTAGSPRMTINMIFGGDKVNRVTFSVAKKTKISVTHGKRIREVSEDDITFTEEYADGFLLPHNDELVISLNVLDFKIKHVLVDPESSTNIIQWKVLEQAKLTGNIIPTTKLLAGFNLTSVTTRGKLLLHTHVEGVTRTTLFEVVDGDMSYNVILRRPGIHEMKDVPSTYHQLLKFPTPDGIKQIRGDQPVAREMNVVTISSSKDRKTSK
uniref:Uncharacterized protein n=1 Tax=Nicotiana tabacum TaxID=4097 RepID=A0A1S4DHT2_TOBAC|nr:uncharacterized protein LOC104107884 [Nicotiana tomentosiformis]XP_016512940.1 PREDICTED: uncharacterized protein LOC107829982 [Nicotiana tabacum]